MDTKSEDTPANLDKALEQSQPETVETAPASNVILSGTVAHLQGMTMELSDAANNLPEGHVLHWHTELVAPVEAVETEEVETEE